MVKLSDVLKIKRPDALSSRYGKAFEKAVFTLIKRKDVAVAMRTFIEHYGEPHTGAFAKLMKLKPWIRESVRRRPGKVRRGADRRTYASRPRPTSS
jgi:hypothetical protein